MITREIWSEAIGFNFDSTPEQGCIEVQTEQALL